jgi:hypothetical protein
MRRRGSSARRPAARVLSTATFVEPCCQCRTRLRLWHLGLVNTLTTRAREGVTWPSCGCSAVLASELPSPARTPGAAISSVEYGRNSRSARESSARFAWHGASRADPVRHATNEVVAGAGRPSWPGCKPPTLRRLPTVSGHRRRRGPRCPCWCAPHGCCCPPCSHE